MGRVGGKHKVNQVSESTIFLHIGMPKAASSYLHGNIFPLLMPGRYVMPGARNAKTSSYRFRRNAFSVRRFSDSFHRQSDFWHHHGEEFLRKYLWPFLHRDREPDSVLVSDEAVTRLNHFSLRRMPNAFDRDEIENHFRLFAQSARRIGFNRIKVLFIIRRQDFLLASSYAQLSRKIIGASQRDFERRVQRLIEKNSNPDKASFFPLDYKSLHQSLTNSLPREHVQLIALEEITHDFQGFTKKLTDFIEIGDSSHAFPQGPANSRLKTENKWGLRPLLLFKSSQIVKSARINFEFTLPRQLTGRAEQIELTPELSGRIMDHFSTPNSRLNELLDIDLCRFGYCAC